MIPELESVDHVHLYVRDRPAAERWYREVLTTYDYDQVARATARV